MWEVGNSAISRWKRIVLPQLLANEALIILEHAKGGSGEKSRNSAARPNFRSPWSTPIFGLERECFGSRFTSKIAFFSFITHDRSNSSSLSFLSWCVNPQ